MQTARLFNAKRAEAPTNPPTKASQRGEGSSFRLVLTSAFLRPSSSGPRAFGLSGASPDDESRRRQANKAALAAAAGKARESRYRGLRNLRRTQSHNLAPESQVHRCHADSMTKIYGMSMLRRMSAKFTISRRDAGATMMEYALLVSLIAIAGLISMQSVGAQVNGRFEHLQSQMEVAGGDLCTPANPLYPNC